MDVNNPLPRHVEILDPNGGGMQQRMQYDWEPIYCTTCCIVGHSYTELQQKEQRNKEGYKKHGWNKDKSNFVMNTHDEGWHTVKGKSETRHTHIDEKMGRHIRTSNNFNTLEAGEYLNVCETSKGSEDIRGGRTSQVPQINI
ncbi:hypothetical protein KY289_001308 [Solanum tuberosum]|nr:hypothetical protein KY289_001308 [Solanum tuberosum]